MKQSQAFEALLHTLNRLANVAEEPAPPHVTGDACGDMARTFWEPGLIVPVH